MPLTLHGDHTPGRPLSGRSDHRAPQPPRHPHPAALLSSSARPTPPFPPHRNGAPSRESAGSRPSARPLCPHLSRRLAMNSGMETVSISTKSALPNSRLSCSAMAPAYGLRWARTDSGGRARAAGDRRRRRGARGELGRGWGGAAAPGAGLRGRGRRAPLNWAGPDGGRPAAPRRALGRRGAPGSFRFSRGGCPELWGDGTPKRRRRRLVPPLAWSSPGPAPPRPGLSGSAPSRPAGRTARPRRGPGRRLLTWAARTGARRAGPGRRGRSAPWGRALGSRGAEGGCAVRRTADVGEWVESDFQNCLLRGN